MGPLASVHGWSAWTVYVVSLLIGVGFGGALEMAGFGDSRKLTGQFYLRDMTVLKVMFGAVISAAVLLGLFSSLGLIDMTLVWVNPTFLWPGVVGGLLMGVGFMIGGFCPGTSVVAAATLKLDGIIFLVGVAIGIFLFGETLPLVQDFWLSSNHGHLTLPEVFGVSTGEILLAVVGVGLGSFALAELSEAKFGTSGASREMRLLPRSVLGWSGVGLLALGALVAAVLGEPTAEERWARISPEAGARLANRSVYVHPYEVAEITRDTNLFTVVLDVRAESDFNLFHLKGSRNLSLTQLADPRQVEQLAGLPDNTVFFTVSWDETAATQAWRLLVAQRLPNTYIVEGGINNWHHIFVPPPCLLRERGGEHQDDQRAFTYLRAVGDCCNTAYPEVAYKQIPTDCWLDMTDEAQARSTAGSAPVPAPSIAFEHKVKLKKAKAVTGGCG